MTDDLESVSGLQDISDKLRMASAPKRDEILESVSGLQDISDKLRMASARTHDEIYEAIRDENAIVLRDLTGLDCKLCHGTGQVVIHKKMTYCPKDCEGSRNLRRDNLLKVLRSFGDIPDIYADFTFETWIESVDSKVRGGKNLAMYTLQYMVNYGGQDFSLYEVMTSDIVRAAVKSRLSIKVEQYQDNKTNDRIRVFIDGNQMFDYFNSVGHSVVLASETKGMGKTGLCVAAAKHLINSGVAVAFVHLPTLLKDTRTAYANSQRKQQGEQAIGHGKTFDELMLPIDRADVLFVDDFNVVGDATRNDLQVVENEIIQKRWASNRPTIITTNHTQDSFETQWGERAASRIFEMCHWIELTGAIVRRRNKVNR